MTNTFNLIITAYNEVIYDGEASYCGFITPIGSLGIEARHEPVLALLKEDSVILYDDSVRNRKTVPIKNGLLSFKKNKCIIVVNT